MGWAYYNEIDPFAVRWLRGLIRAGRLPDGEVDERGIQDVCASDLAGFTQHHFFAGIGGWSLALQLAGWPDDRPVWTGSCPCQSFSSAGRQLGFADERHLWPVWFRLIEQCRPAALLGEQVASPLALEWFDLVSSDLEGAGYAVGAADLCAAGVGAPHIRQRLFFVADSQADGRGEERSIDGRLFARDRAQGRPAGLMPSGADGELADSQCPGLEIGPCVRRNAIQERQAIERDCELGVPDGRGCSSGRPSPEAARHGDAALAASFWADAEWIECRDGKSRPVEPGVRPLASGLSDRVGLLRGYGNSIVPQVAAEFVMAYLEA